MKGTWVGASLGLNTAGLNKGQDKYVITKVRGSSASGTWQYRASAKKKSSKPKPLNLSAYDMENDHGIPTVYICGGDERGVFVGKLMPTEKTLKLAYTSVSQGILDLTLDRRKP